ncbi:protein DEFECTIVE IN MERISTEM SILENCING 3-like [Asparagus officinalis]|uniref:protein DEFECTIVE IN MERISTEM SILENCING 3-like n=1 Tax=Asparagus officinalis TaxID=4686 RepID=UPI00098E6547|nr:protein DEFECTIVE IN MERISTEM SILENCING 3-like [Asparagus officinalis]
MSVYAIGEQVALNRAYASLNMPYKGGLKKNDPQRKLALPNPLLPSQGIPAGFLGYAVNMIELDVHHLNTRTARGYGLRETLFYRLLGEAQVYETREHMRMAAGCIKHGALSLDGGIMKDNGVIFLGDHEPAVRFPVAVPNEQGRLSRQNIHDMEQIEEKKAYLAHICEEINKEGEAHSKAVAKFYKKKDKYHKYLDKKRILNMDNLLGQSTRLSTS